MVSVFGEQIIQAILSKQNPSKICNDLQVFQCNGCSLNKQGTENVFAPSAHPIEEAFAFLLAHWLKKSRQLESPSSNNNQELLPIADMDKDYFSPLHGLYRYVYAMTIKMLKEVRIGVVWIVMIRIAM